MNEAQLEELIETYKNMSKSLQQLSDVLSRSVHRLQDHLNSLSQEDRKEMSSDGVK